MVHPRKQKVKRMRSFFSCGQMEISLHKLPMNDHSSSQMTITIISHKTDSSYNQATKTNIKFSLIQIKRYGLTLLSLIVVDGFVGMSLRLIRLGVLLVVCGWETAEMVTVSGRFSGTGLTGEARLRRWW